jgi:hypothetical protein
MLSKINSKNELIAFDEQIAVEYEGKEHIVDLKFSRRQAIELAQVSKEYYDNIMKVVDNEGGLTIEKVEKDFLKKMLKFIDVSFIKSDEEKVNTLLLIYEQLKQSV